ncbi:MAG: hypothetical protein ABW321_02610 [Polyangiales bacterium]
MQPSATHDPFRGVPFGIRTRFARHAGLSVNTLKLALVRLAKSERDARQLGSLHFAFWALISRAKLARLTPPNHPRPRERRGQMLFLSDFAGDWEVYLAGFNTALRSALDLVWGNAEGWSYGMTLGQYLAFIRARQINADAYYQAYGNTATPHDVRSALALSEELDRFIALTLEELSPEQFNAAYHRFKVKVDSHL